MNLELVYLNMILILKVIINMHVTHTYIYNKTELESHIKIRNINSIKTYLFKYDIYVNILKFKFYEVQFVFSLLYVMSIVN